jgi:hypothetical protein
MRTSAQQWNDYVICEVRKEMDKHWPKQLLRPGEIMKLYKSTSELPSFGLLMIAVKNAAQYEKKQGKQIDNLFPFLLAMLKKWNWNDKDRNAAKAIDRQHTRYFLGLPSKAAELTKSLVTNFRMSEKVEKDGRKGSDADSG